MQTITVQRRGNHSKLSDTPKTITPVFDDGSGDCRVELEPRLETEIEVAERLIKKITRVRECTIATSSQIGPNAYLALAVRGRKQTGNVIGEFLIEYSDK